MANIKLKNSAISGKVPLTADLDYGELALNYNDKKLYFKSSTNTIESFTLSAAGTGSTATQYARQTYTATAGQTTFAVLYDAPLVEVYITGVLLDSSEYTATDGSTIVLNTGADVGALVECIGLKNLNITIPVPNPTGNSGKFLSTDGTNTSWVTISPRVVTIADGTSITVNINITDIAAQVNTQATGTLTINNITGTPADGQKFVIRLKSTNVQTFSWNAIFSGSSDLPLPSVSSGSNKYDYLGFIYNSTAAKWQLVAKNFGF